MTLLPNSHEGLNDVFITFFLRYNEGMNKVWSEILLAGNRDESRGRTNEIAIIKYLSRKVVVCHYLKSIRLLKIMFLLAAVCRIRNALLKIH